MIYFLTILFVGTVLFGSFFNVSPDLILILLVITAGVFFYALILRIQRRNTKIVAWLVISLALVILSFLRISAVAPDQEIIESLNGKFVILSGKIVTAPEVRETRGRLILGNLNIDGQVYEHLRVLVWYDLGLEIGLEDEVDLKGVLEIPADFETDSGRIFEYQEYLSKDDIYFEVSNPRDLKITRSASLSIGRILQNTKSTFISRMESVLPEPHSSLAGGILLGEKQSLGDVWQEKFRTVGLTHIVVLSGYNISIVVMVILYLLSGLSLIFSSVLSIAGIILFALLVGGGATVIRASLMAGLLIVARYFNRPYDALRALFVAGFIMILLNPRILVHDLSFQLSFLATLGIILFSPVATRIFSKIPKKLGLREILITTFSAQIFVLPWIVYTMGSFSPISFLANILVLPTIPLAMLFSFISGVLPVFLVSLPAYWLLGYTLFVTDTLSKIPYASISIPKMPLILVVIFYMLLLYITWRFTKE